MAFNGKEGRSAFNGKEGKPITVGQAKRWMKKFQDQYPKEAKAFFFGCDYIRQLLDERDSDGDCKGIRIYFALDDEEKMRLILVGATANKNNIVPKDDGKGGNDQLILDEGAGCPPDCPTNPNDPFG